MALTTCKECKKEISTEARVCPHCGYKPKRTSLLTWIVLILIVFGVGKYWSLSSEQEEQAAAAARAQAARVAALTPEQKKREADAKARAEELRRRKDAATERASVGAKALKKSANNPDSFKLESALVIDTSGAVCYEFRAANAFGGIVKGQAVLAADGKRFLTNTDSGFTRLWNAECAGKVGREVAAAIRWIL